MLIILGLIGVTFLFSCSKNSEDTPQHYADAINNNFDAKIYLLGDDIGFEYNLEYTRIDSFVECDSDAEYKFIIINFNTTEYNLDNNDLEILYNLVHSHQYKIMYAHFQNYFTQIYNSEIEIIDSDNSDSEFDIYLVDYQTTTSFKSSVTNEVMIISLIAQCLKTYL